ncbi:hypothetical protein CEP51_007783 [Fusarium floridanum]|uniref:Uncharacterized protein n=1 Tax=Fusarium floridanum TaxID=1325733 RepID=A0A428RN22_9HYPO|nr:hypothetical protein CEP51_007783 [Fusarium floridanum]
MPKSREPHGERVGHQVLDSLEIQTGLHLAGLKSGERPKGRMTGIFAVLVSVDFISEIGWPHGYVSGPLPNLQHKVAKSRRSISGRGDPWSSGPPMLDQPSGSHPSTACPRESQAAGTLASKNAVLGPHDGTYSWVERCNLGDYGPRMN